MTIELDILQKSILVSANRQPINLLEAHMLDASLSDIESLVDLGLLTPTDNLAPLSWSLTPAGLNLAADICPRCCSSMKFGKALIGTKHGSGITTESHQASRRGRSHTCSVCGNIEELSIS